MRRSAPRWLKVIRDLTSNKSRTVLVVLSIAIGVMAVGAVLGAQAIVEQDLPRDFMAIDPAAGFAITVTNFDDDVVDQIEAMEEVGTAEGRRILVAPFQTQSGDWRNLQLSALPDYENIKLNKIVPEEGIYPPPAGTILIERSAFVDNLGFTDIEIGDYIRVKAPNGKERDLQIVGTVHELNQFPPQLIQTAYGYVSFETMEMFNEPKEYNQMLFTISDELSSQYDWLNLSADDRRVLSAEASRVGKLIQDKMEATGASVIFVVSLPPGQMPTQTILDGISWLLLAMGLLSLGLSVFLIVNTLSAILTQQVRQIGIMKSIGAQTSQLTVMYYFLVLIFGLLALAISVPSSALLSGWLARLFASILNFNVREFAFNWNIIFIQAGIALIVPVLAATYPIIRGTRTTVREAISDHTSGGGGQFGTSYVDLFVVGLKTLIPMMKRPAQISLRNTFRRKGRLILTLTSLSLASLIFMSILSIQSSIQTTLDESLGIFQFDIQIRTSREYRIDRLVRQAENNPYVTVAESWGFGGGRRVRPDDTESDNIIFYAPPINAVMVDPVLISGRFLQEGDTNAVVVTNDLLRAEEDLTEENVLGQRLTFNIAGKESEWVVVGVARGAVPAATAWVPQDTYERITNTVGQSQAIFMKIDRSLLTEAASPFGGGSVDGKPTIDEVASQIETEFRDAGFRVEETQTIELANSILTLLFLIPILLLLAMAVVLGFVGGLGLMGTMSINVIERLREIGVMRAIGASDRSVLGIVMLEGLIIGFLSWMIGGLFSFPFSYWLTQLVGEFIFASSLSYIFSWSGVALWLFIVLFLAMLASFIPARNASKVTVREVLSYEG